MELNDSSSDWGETKNAETKLITLQKIGQHLSAILTIFCFCFYFIFTMSILCDVLSIT